MRYHRPRSIFFLCAISLILLSAVTVPAAAGGAGKSVHTCITYQYPAASLVAGDEIKLARYDLFSFNRHRYYQLQPNTYDPVRALNPDIIIYNYQQGSDTWLSSDGENVMTINNIGRYNNPMGHSMGNLNTDNPHLFCLDSGGNRIWSYGNSNRRWLDFGNPDFHAYWLEATIHDIVDQEWRPDGVYVDNMMVGWASYFCPQRPANYPTDADWLAGMLDYHRAMAAGLHARGVQLWTNTDGPGDATTYDAWLTLDAEPDLTRPDLLGSEGSFVHSWNGNYVATFYDATRWKRQVDIMREMQNCGSTTYSHVNMPEGGSGTDNYGKPVTYWDTLWYSIGSYLLGKNDDRATGNLDYFYFSNSTDRYYKLYWYDEYERIDLGPAVGDYVKTVHSGRDIYWREYVRGYVYVNPTSGDSASIPLPQACKQLSHETINDDPATFPDVTSIPLVSHRAAILLKTASLDAASVIGRHIFYNNSAFDGYDSAANAADDGAIATDKEALQNDPVATFANYTSFMRGINGLMVDIQGLLAAPTATDFEFTIGNDNDQAGWASAPAPTSVTVRNSAGVGGSDRVTIIWPDNAIDNTWLRVTVKETVSTGLGAPDVFYFGNAIGETGNSPTDANVTPADEVAVRNNPATLTNNPAGLTHLYDFNRDRKVGPTDAVLARNNGTNIMTALKYINLIANQAPDVDAGPYAVVSLPATSAALDGTVSDDGYPVPPGAMTTTWSKISGPGAVTFTNASAVDTTATFSTIGVYVLQLEAFDGQYTVSDTVEIRSGDTSGILFEDNFNDNDISDWVVISGSGWAAASGEAVKLANDSTPAGIKNGGFSVSSGTITLEFDLRVPGAWRPGNAGLVDADGDGIYLDTYIGENYVQIGAKNTPDNALTGTGGGFVDAPCDPGSGVTIKYEVNLDTGEVKGYIDGDLKYTVTLDLSGVGAITNVVLQAKKNWSLDNLVVSD